MTKKKSQKEAQEGKMAEQDVSIEDGSEELVQETEAASEEVTEDMAEEVIIEGESENEDTTEDIADVVSRLEEENRDYQDKLLRLSADVDNYKKRMERERAASLKYAEERIIKELLPTIDNLERALEHQDTSDSEDIKTLVEGVELTLKGLLSTVDKFGLTSLVSVGEPFDPNFHEALVMEASDDVPAQSVIREFEKGYQFKERLLRAAKVVVSKGPEKNEK